jgi:ubiquinone biosynthesis protein
LVSLRFYKILKTFFQYGLDDFLPKEKLPWYGAIARYSVFWLRNKHKDKTQAERLRLAIESLGPVFIKFGQMLSTRRDLLPDDIANELAKLQDQVKPFDGALAKKIIIDAIGQQTFEQYFSDFEEVALASASIAQVHTATLIDKETGSHKQIVIKVTRPGIKKTIDADLNMMSLGAKLIDNLMPDGKRLRPIEVIEEYKKTILDELDLMHEAANAIQLKRNFDESNVLYVPHIYSDYCRSNVLVMERIYGVGVAEIDELHSQNVNMKLLAERGVQVFFTQVFRDSFFHADMHPGNVFVDTTNPNDPTWIAIDCGIVGTLNKDDKRYLAENFVAFFNRDYRKVAELHVDSGWVPSDTKIEDFEVAIRTVCEPIFAKPLAEISFGHVLINLFNTARRFNMSVQPQLVLLQKTLLYIEGLGRQLYPQLDLWQTAKPFLEDWIKQQIGPKALFNNVKDNLPFWGEKLPEVPDLVYDYLKTGRETAIMQQQLLFEIKSQKQQQHNRLLLGIFASSSLVSATLCYVNQYTTLAAAGLTIAALIFGYLLKK